VPSARRCANDGACDPGFACIDIDGDGDTECQFMTGFCQRHSDCPTGELCGLGDGFAAAVCGTSGTCTDDDDCSGSDRCLSLYGADVRVCVPPTGTCTSVTDCAANQLCGVRSGGTSLECLP